MLLIYSVVIPSKDLQNLKFCIQNLVAHSDFLQDIVIIWNGNDEEYQKLCAWMQENDYLKSQVVLLRDDVYKMYNHGIELAKYNLVLLINDDMYVPLSWDTPLMDIVESGNEISDAVITTQLVESGYIDVNPKNIECDFGKDWNEFDIVGFNLYATQYSDERTAFVQDFGWYMPVFIHKKWFMQFGKYPTTMPFPHPNDIEFFNRVLISGKVQPLKLNSLVYHFQRLSQRTNPDFQQDLPTKLNLCCGGDLREDYLNADSVANDPRVFKLDILNDDLEKLPSDYFEEILFFHALEHFRFEDGEYVVRQLYRILKQSSILHIAVPDLKMACEDYLNGYNRPNCANPLLRIYGQNTSDELVHKAGYDEADLFLKLQNVGFHVEIKDPRHPDEIYMECMK